MYESNSYQLTKTNNDNKDINTNLLNNDIDEDEDDNYEDNDTNLLNNDNEEFSEFKNSVKEWLTLDDDIITLQKAIKDRKFKKNDLTPKILDFMNRFKINDLNTLNGKLKFTKSLQTKPLNKQFLISRLGDFFKDFTKGEKAASFILENRDKEEKLKLRRVINKKELNL
jgi:hypothetical protein